MHKIYKIMCGLITDLCLKLKETAAYLSRREICEIGYTERATTTEHCGKHLEQRSRRTIRQKAVSLVKAISVSAHTAQGIDHAQLQRHGIHTARVVLCKEIKHYAVCLQI